MCILQALVRGRGFIFRRKSQGVGDGQCLAWLSETLVDVRHGAWPWEITRLQLRDLESSRGDELVHFAVEVTPAGEGLPEGSEAILPGNDAGIGRAAVLEKDETPARP